MMATKTELFAGPLDGLEVVIPPGLFDEDADPQILVMGHVYCFDFERFRFRYERSVV